MCPRAPFLFTEGIGSVTRRKIISYPVFKGSKTSVYSKIDSVPVDVRFC